MALVPDQVTLELLADPATLGIIATTDEAGAVEISVSNGLGVDEEGRLVHLELLESSATTRNLLRALWFDGSVAVLLHGPKGSRVLRGRPHKVHISGPVFRRHYEAVQQRLGDAGLAGVWLVEVGEIAESGYGNLREREKALFPFHRHLDQFVRKEAYHG